MGYGYLGTGQTSCHDAQGAVVDCAGSGQDAEFRAGLSWPTPRFVLAESRVEDRLTGLMWPANASLAEFPMTWLEALAWIAELNHERFLGFADWRLPNRRELTSLTSRQTRKPALPQGHPFTNVFQHWYWSATTAAPSPAHAWCVHFEGARLFYGGKDQSYMAWPVRGTSPVLPATGQLRCFDAQGHEIACEGIGQDGTHRAGIAWPVPRFEIQRDGVLDGLTGLVWRRAARCGDGLLDWSQALAAVSALNRGGGAWRLPNILELESLVDCDQGRIESGPAGAAVSRWAAALPVGHPFVDLEQGYWSSTTSLFEPDWAWALYLDKGAVGVGQKRGVHFQAWAVRDAAVAAPDDRTGLRRHPTKA